MKNFRLPADFFEKYPLMKQVREVSHRRNEKAFLVGGFVRDLLLGKTSKDIDIVIIGNGTAFAEDVANQIGRTATLSVFKNFGTANLKIEKLEVEFVGARKESYLRNSRKPLVEQGTLEEDLSRRDFTINALAIDLSESDVPIIDLFNGLTDLHKGVIKTPLDPAITFSDDPLRMMRAVRFMSVLQFKLDTSVTAALAANFERIRIISGERIIDELNKIILSKKPSDGFKVLEECGLLQIIFPDLVKLKGVKTIDNKSHKDNFYHTLQVLDNVSESGGGLWLRWAALLHDIGKPASQKYSQEEGWTFHGHEVIGAKMVPRIFKDLKLPMNEKMKYVQKLVLLHLRPIALTSEVTDSAIRRLIVDAGEDIEDLMILCKADVTSKNPEKVKKYLNRFDEVWNKIQEVEEKDRLRNWKPPITGEIIMQTFSLNPCKTVGIIKEEIKEAILEGIIPNDFDAAYDKMIEIGLNMGLTIPKKN